MDFQFLIYSTATVVDTRLPLYAWQVSYTGCVRRYTYPLRKRSTIHRNTVNAVRASFRRSDIYALGNIQKNRKIGKHIYGNTI